MKFNRGKKNLTAFDQEVLIGYSKTAMIMAHTIGDIS